MLKRHVAAARQGFTFIEVMAVLTLVMMVLVWGVPSVVKMLIRERLLGVAREAANSMRLARSETVKTQIPVGVKQDFAADQVITFRDENRNDIYDGPDVVLARQTWSRREVRMLGPSDSESSRPNASVGFGEPNPASALEGTVVFTPLGGASASGAFRFSDSSGKNFIEVRVEPAATGRVSLRKYVSGDPAVKTNWKEQDEGGAVWTWAN